MEVWGKKVSREQDTLPCKPCEDRDLFTPAHGFCAECEVYMCNKCFDTHKQFKVCQGHTMTNLDEGLVKKWQKEDIEKCEKHFSEMVKFYCQQHEQVGCGDCMILEHKPCKVEYIRDKASTFKDSREFKDLVKGAETCHTEAKKMLSSIKNNKVQVKDINEKFNQDVNMLKDEIMSHITKMATTMLRQGRDVMETDIERMNILEKDIEGMINELSVLTEEFESHIDRPNKLFVSSVLQKPKLKRLRDQLEGMKGNNKIEMYEFKCDDNLETLVKDCKQLGRIKQRTDMDFKAEDDEEEKQQQQQEQQQQKQEEVRPKEKQQIVQAAGPSKPQPLLDKQLTCRNMTVDREYLSYADNGSGNVGLYVNKNRIWTVRYFEVEIISLGQSGTIAIGLVPRDYPENHFPGRRENSIGFDTKDGKLYSESDTGKKFGPKCNVGDRIGCGLVFNWTYPYVVFTRNGEKVGKQQIPFDCYYPAVGMHSAGEKVRVILDAAMPQF